MQTLQKGENLVEVTVINDSVALQLVATIDYIIDRTFFFLSVSKPLSPF